MDENPKIRVNKESKEIKIKKGDPIADAPLQQSTSYEGQPYDILLHAWMGKMVGWLSPASLALASYDWLVHLSIAPAKQMTLMQHMLQNSFEFYINTTLKIMNNPASEAEHFSYIKPRSSDSRFKEEGWEQFPFNAFSEFFTLCERGWDEATSSIRGVSKHHEQVVHFSARQILDMLSPSNFVWTNPEILRVTLSEGGGNFVNGFHNFIEDLSRSYHKQPPVGTEKFKVGIDVAITPGKVIYKNNLIELIQYQPTTKKVYAEPILMVPAWIMKYYILDLSPNNSLVKYLVDHGHTVFMISWKNPSSEDRNLGLDDYLNLGIMNAIEVINQIIPNRKIHSVGYCLGGTLLMMAAAAMAGQNDDRLQR